MGADAEALSLFRESLALSRELREHWSLLNALNGLGQVELGRGELAESRAAFSEALRLGWEMRAPAEVLQALAGMARWRLKQESPEADAEAALVLALFVLNHPSARQKLKEESYRLRAELEARLTPQQVEAAQAQAQAHSLSTLVEQILGSLPAPA